MNDEAKCMHKRCYSPNITFLVSNPNDNTLITISLPGSLFNLEQYPNQPGICQAIFINLYPPAVAGAALWISRVAYLY